MPSPMRKWNLLVISKNFTIRGINVIELYMFVRNEALRGEKYDAGRLRLLSDEYNEQDTCLGYGNAATPDGKVDRMPGGGILIHVHRSGWLDFVAFCKINMLRKIYVTYDAIHGATGLCFVGNVCSCGRAYSWYSASGRFSLDFEDHGEDFPSITRGVYRYRLIPFSIGH